MKNLGAWAQDKMRIEAGRFAAYRDYELMDAEMPEVSSALGVFAEFSTQSDDPKAETFKIDCDDEDFGGYLKDKADQLKLPMLVTPTGREITRYGTSSWECVSEDNAGDLTLVRPLAVATMRRNGSVATFLLFTLTKLACMSARTDEVHLLCDVAMATLRN